jgi:hypothetical protein
MDVLSSILASAIDRRRAPARQPLVGALLAALLAACGPGPAPPGFGESEHAGDMIVGSTADGGGDLAVEYDFDEPVVVTLSTSIGSFILYTASEPGFDLLVRDEPEESFYVLSGGVDVRLEVVEIEPGVQIKIGDAVLDAVGESAELGTTPELHLHPEWQLVLPEDAAPGEYGVSFKLTTTSSVYGESAVHAVTIAVGEGE